MESLYYECHITIEPVDADSKRFTELKRIASSCGFRVADLLLKKRSQDTPQRSMYDTFMTSRAASLWVIEVEMTLCIYSLQKAGFKVWRYKIEAALVDSQLADRYGLLAPEDRQG